MLRRWFAAAGFSLLGALSSGALANGRFPAADQLTVDPSDERHLLLRATFGLLISRDEGKSFGWVCEDAVGYTGDPALGVLAGGGLLAGFFGELRASTDDGCSWSSAPPEPAVGYPTDLTLDPSDPSQALVVSYVGDASQTVRLLRATAAGALAVGEGPGQGFFPLTIEVAPSRPERIYVSGFTIESKSLVLRSDDGGQTWRRFDVEPHGTFSAYIAAVDPLDPDRLYLRVDSDAADYLLVSADGGESWREAFALDSKMLGFALSPDGKTIAVGGPRFMLLPGGGRSAVGGPNSGLYLASSQELVFEPARAQLLGLQCLKWTARGLFACADETLDGFTLALSTNAAESFTPLWHVKELTPLRCPSPAGGGLCAAQWPRVAATVGADPNANQPQPAAPNAPNDSSCAFRTRAAAHRHGLLVLLGALLGLARRGRGARRNP